jgi:hypothetical protein
LCGGGIWRVYQIGDVDDENNKKIKFLNINSKSILTNLNTKRNFSS